MIDWSLGIEDIIYSMIIAKFPKTVRSKYPDITFDTIKETKPAQFPTVYITVKLADTGKTLDGKGINAVDCRLQIDVITNTSKRDAKEVIGEIMNIVTGMRFTVTEIPTFEKETNYYRSTLVGTRVIGSSDTL